MIRNRLQVVSARFVGSLSSWSRLPTLVLAAVLPLTAQAQEAPSLVPTVASVQEAEPIPFRAALGSDLSDVRGVGVVADAALSVAWFDAEDDLLWVSFRLAGDRPVDVERLVVSLAGGSVHEVAAGSVAVHPAADPSAPLVAIAEIVDATPSAGPGWGAWLFENRSAEPVRIASVAYAPSDVASDLVLVRSFAGSTLRDDFRAWALEIEDAVQATLDAAGNGAETGVPSELEPSLARAFGPDVRTGVRTGVRTSEGTLIEIAPGAAMGLVVTPASFTAEVADDTLFIDPAVATISPDGVRTVTFTAGPTARFGAP